MSGNALSIFLSNWHNSELGYYCFADEETEYFRVHS